MFHTRTPAKVSAYSPRSNNNHRYMRGQAFGSPHSQTLSHPSWHPMKQRPDIHAEPCPTQDRSQRSCDSTVQVGVLLDRFPGGLDEHRVLAFPAHSLYDLRQVPHVGTEPSALGCARGRVTVPTLLSEPRGTRAASPGRRKLPGRAAGSISNTLLLAGRRGLRSVMGEVLLSPGPCSL